jgi:hypothetical protein
MSERTRFVYHTRTREQLLRHIAIGNWDDWIYQAYKKDTKGLCDYLRDPDLPLDEKKREALADLIEQRIQRKEGKGRKPGAAPSAPGKLTTGDVVAAARVRLKRIKARNGGRAPRGSYKQVLEDLCRFYGDEGYNVDINFEKAIDDLSRGAVKRSVKKR